MRKLLIIAAGLLAFWNLPAADEMKKAIVELLVVGKIPGTEVYLGLGATLLIVLVLIIMLIQWAKTLMTDLIDFSLELHRKEQATLKQLASQKVNQPTQSKLNYSDGLTEDDLDLLSV